MSDNASDRTPLGWVDEVLAQGVRSLDGLAADALRAGDRDLALRFVTAGDRLMAPTDLDPSVW